MAGRLQQWQAIPGEVLEVDVSADGWPYHIQVGDDIEAARPERYRGRGGVRATAWRRVPQLGAGVWPVVVHDRHGSTHVGQVRISRP